MKRFTFFWSVGSSVSTSLVRPVLYNFAHSFCKTNFPNCSGSHFTKFAYICTCIEHEASILDIIDAHRRCMYRFSVLLYIRTNPYCHTTHITDTATHTTTHTLSNNNNNNNYAISKPTYHLPLATGDNINKFTHAAPVLWPINVTAPISPPNVPILSLTHCNAAI